MKSVGTAKGIECTFGFYHLSSSGKLTVFFETTIKGGDRSIEIRTPDTDIEQDQILKAIQRAEANKHMLKKHKLDRTPKATTEEGSMFK